MSVLITGGAGFIGMRMIKTLQDTVEVISLSRTAQKEQTHAVALRGAFHQLEDLRQLDKHKIDVLLHLGAATGECSDKDVIETNVAGTGRLVRYLLDRGCRKFVLASSIAATGCLSGGFIPLKLPIPDDHPCLAIDAYGISKALMEEYICYFSRYCSDGDFMCLRLGAVMDDANNTSTPVKAGDKMWGPFCQLAHVSISDIVHGISLAVHAKRQPGFRLYNMVGPEAYCIDLVRNVLRPFLGKDFLDISHYEQAGHEFDPVYSIDRIRADLGYNPTVSATTRGCADLQPSRKETPI